MMQKCYRCNIQFQDNKVRFCPYCGSPLAIDKEYEEEQRRKEKEYQDSLERKRRWEEKCKPVITRFNVVARELYTLMRDPSFPYNLGQINTYGYSSINNEEQLAKLESTVTRYEDFLGAAYDKGDSNRFNRLVALIKVELDKLDSNYKKYSAYSNISSTFSSFINKFLNSGGTISFETNVSSWETDDYKRDGSDESHVAITVDYSSIPLKDKERYRLKHPSYAPEGYTYVYKRYSIYTQRTYHLHTFTFPYGGLKGKLRSVSIYSSGWGKSILSIYSDLLTFNKYFDDFVKGYAAPSKSFNADELLRLNLLTVTKKMEYKQDPKKFDRYAYYQHSKRK